jgi:putative membrane protein
MERTAVSRHILAALLFSLAFVAAAADSALSKSDQRFLQKAAAGGMAEVELGKLAQEKAIHAEVQQFGKRMVEDHAKANEELKSVASANGVALPDSLDKKQQKLLAKLQKMPAGIDFDAEYMKSMVADHRKDLHEFREEAKSKRDNAAKAFAAKSVPMLQGHYDLALATNDIAQAPKRTGSRTTGSTKP